MSSREVRLSTVTSRVWPLICNRTTVVVSLTSGSSSLQPSSNPNAATAPPTATDAPTKVRRFIGSGPVSARAVQDSSSLIVGFLSMVAAHRAV